MVPSSTRLGALGKYLSSLSKHLQQDVKQESNDLVRSSTSRIARKRLHILYLLNDLLHHTKYHEQNASLFSSVSGSLQSFIADVVQSTALAGREKVHRRLNELLDIWTKEKYYGKAYVDKLRETIATTPNAEEVSAPATTTTAPRVSSKATKDLPFVMPATHGDTSTPFFDLPAGNLMPHIMPNSSAAIRPDQVRALQFVAGPAEQSLVHALKEFLNEVDRIDSLRPMDDEGSFADIDELGQIWYRDENGDIVTGDSYYGWSRTFCERMKKRRDGDDEDRPLRARSYSSSRSPSRTPRKRRRYSDSTSSRSDSRSRSNRARGNREDRDRQGDASPLRRTSHGRRPRSQSSSYSPQLPTAVPAQPSLLQNPRQTGFAPSLPPPIPHHPSTSFNMLPNHLPSQPTLSPNGLPFPPPPPPNFAGSWPPPTMNFPTGMPFPPPPPAFPPPNNWFAGNRPGDS